MNARTEQEVLLVLADVSGYTRYMVANRTEAVHSQGIITELLEAVIHEVEMPLEISKLEGDAVFMFAERCDGLDWSPTCQDIGARMGAFMGAFEAKLRELQGSLTCPCGACRNLDRLALKVVAHAGKAVRHQVGRFEELAGVDVILVHRMLKNEVQGKRYFLFSEPAFELLQPEHAETFQTTSLEDRDLGLLPLRVRLLDPPASTASKPNSWLWAKVVMMAREARWQLRAWRSPRVQG